MPLTEFFYNQVLKSFYISTFFLKNNNKNLVIFDLIIFIYLGLTLTSLRNSMILVPNQLSFLDPVQMKTWWCWGPIIYDQLSTLSNWRSPHSHWLPVIYLPKKIFTWKFTPYVPLSKVANIGLDVAQLMSFGAYKDPDKWLWALAWFKKSTKVSIRKYW